MDDVWNNWVNINWSVSYFMCLSEGKIRLILMLTLEAFSSIKLLNIKLLKCWKKSYPFISWGIKLFILVSLCFKAHCIEYIKFSKEIESKNSCIEMTYVYNQSVCPLLSKRRKKHKSYTIYNMYFETRMCVLL